MANSAHDNFLIEACIMKIQTECDNPDSDCAKAEVYKCLEQFFSLKLAQTKDYRDQKCWQFHVEQY